METLFKRIGKEIDIKKLSNQICKTYQLGEYQKYELIFVGIDDLSYYLDTTKGRYVVKIINHEKTKEEIEGFIRKNLVILKNGIKAPKILSNGKENLFTCNIDGVTINLIVMECIEGSDLYSLNEEIARADIDKLINVLIPLHRIKEKVNNKEYDEYCFMQIKKDYQKTKSLLPNDIKQKVEEAIEVFNKIELDQLPKCFIHGDLISTNIMKDKKNDLWLIDFYQSGNGIRLLDIVKILNSVIDNYQYKDKTEELEQYFLEQYGKRIPLTNYELEVLPILRKIDVVTGIMLETYDAIKDGNSEENEFWLKNDTYVFERLSK